MGKKLITRRSKIELVTMLLDKRRIVRLTRAPYRVTVDITKLRPGKHSLVANARMRVPGSRRTSRKQLRFGFVVEDGSASLATGYRGQVESVSDTPTEPVDYAALNAVWGALATGMLLATRDDAPPAHELPLFGLATFALTKALAKEKVGSWVRDPLVDEGSRQPKGRRLRYAAGELMTCTRCLGTWSSLGLIALRVARPREGRIIASVLATAGINDWLQSGFTLLANRSNLTEREAEHPEEASSLASA